MCNPAWHPIWRDIGTAARRVKPGVVYALVGAMIGEGQRAAQLSASTWSAGLGFKPHIIERVIEVLKARGLIVDGIPTEEMIHLWGNGSDDDRYAVTSSVTPLRQRPFTGAERQAIWRANHPEYVEIRRIRRAEVRAARRPNPAVTSPVTSDALSLSLFPDQEQEKEKQTPRAREPDVTAEFAELWAIWPEHENQGAAEQAYRKARRHADAATLLNLGRDYLDKKPAWRGCMYLGNWLRTEPWKDRRQAPLALPPQPIPTPEHHLGEAGERLTREFKMFPPWARDIVVDRRDPLVISVSSAFQRQYLREQHEGAICRAWRVERVEIVVRLPAAPANDMQQAG